VAEVIKSEIKLTNQEQGVLQMLSREGALTPSQVAAETLTTPAELNVLLRSLADIRLVIVRDDNTPDGKVVILTGEGREALAGSRDQHSAA
jgi:DNA-binding MarR family transcriptional regulator